MEKQGQSQVLVRLTPGDRLCLFPLDTPITGAARAHKATWVTHNTGEFGPVWGYYWSIKSRRGTENSSLFTQRSTAFLIRNLHDCAASDTAGEYGFGRCGQFIEAYLMAHSL